MMSGLSTGALVQVEVELGGVVAGPPLEGHDTHGLDKHGPSCMSMALGSNVEELWVPA